MNEYTCAGRGLKLALGFILGHSFTIFNKASLLINTELSAMGSLPRPATNYKPSYLLLKAWLDFSQPAHSA